MTAIHGTLLIRRLNELQRKREHLAERQDRLRRTLPDWTLAPLELAGLSGAEISALMRELSVAEREAGLDELEAELQRIEGEIEDLENRLLATPAPTLEGIQATLDLAVSRFRAQTTSDPNDVFYDYGDARVLAFLERASDDLRALIATEHRRAG